MVLATTPTHFEPFLVPFDGTAEDVRAVVEPTLATIGLELVQLVYVRAPHKDTLRLFIDRPDTSSTTAANGAGVSMAEIEQASRLLSDTLDVADQQGKLFPHAYDLEVGSPGVDRPLTKKRHFQLALGDRIKVKTKAPYANARSLSGVLRGSDDATFSLALDSKPLAEASEPIRVRFDDVQSAHTIFVFQAPQKPGHGQKPGKKKHKQKSPR